MHQVGAGSGSATVALSIFGPAGMLDLVVPAGATAHDLARAYAAEAGLAAIPLVQTPLGEVVIADRPLADLGCESGDVLIAVAGIHRTRESTATTSPRAEAAASGPIGSAAVALAAVSGLLAGWFGARVDSPGLRYAVAGLLLAGALLAVVPLGRLVRGRQVAAPAFAAAAALTVVAGEGSHQAPAVVALCALAAIVMAAVARALAADHDQELMVWLVAGSVVALVCAAVPVLGLPDRACWTVLVLASALAARIAPSYAVDVPDHALLDLDRLAVTAWSARDSGRGRRGRMVVGEAAVRSLVGRGTRTVTAAAVAIAAVLAIAVPQLLATAVVDLDRIGARALALLAGASVLLAARSYRHRAARTVLRLGGLWCWLVLLATSQADASPPWRVVTAVLAVLLGLAVCAAAVAIGRGWRSVWWARQAELAETLSGAFAIAAAVTSSGVFRYFWEISS